MQTFPMQHAFLRVFFAFISFLSLCLAAWALMSLYAGTQTGELSLLEIIVRVLAALIGLYMTYKITERVIYM